MGANIVDFATLSIAEQARVAREAEFVIGSHGAALVNALFCRHGSTLIEVIPSDYHNRCYEWLAHVCDLVYCPAYDASSVEDLWDDLIAEGRQDRV